MKSPKNLPLSGCLRSPGLFMRQKSFNTLNELSRFCPMKNVNASYSLDDNILPNNANLDNGISNLDRSENTSDNSVILRKPSTSISSAASNTTTSSSLSVNSNQANNKNKPSSLNFDNFNSININYNNNNNSSLNVNKNIENSYTESLHDTLVHEYEERRDHLNERLNQQTQNHNQNTFRWSEQITQSVSVAKIRSAISCNADDLREMEFLLPPPPATSTNHTTALTGNHIGGNSLSIAPQTPNQTKNSSSSLSSSLSSLSPIAKGLSFINSSCNTSAQQKKQSEMLENGQQLANKIDNQQQQFIMSNAKHVKLNSSESNTPQYYDENISSNGNINGNLNANLIFQKPNQIQSQQGILRNKPGHTPNRNSSKMTKKQLKMAQAQLEKLTQTNLHLHALFSAVEHGHLEKAKTILESTDVDINSFNTDGLSALDVAVLSNNRTMTKMLLQHGAVDSSQYSNETIGTKLNTLLKDAESRIYNLSGSEQTIQPTSFSSRASISSIIIGNTTSSVTGCTGNEVDKQIGIWERRVKGLRRMLMGWDQARPPDAPASVTVDVTGETFVTVQILEPFEGAIGTKFKVQWATRSDFNNVVGEREILEWSSFHGTLGAICHIGGLTQGRRYFVRAACGNVKGFGPYKSSIPSSVVPSSWRDLNNLEDRYIGRQKVLDNLFTAVRLARPADVSELSLDPSSVQRRLPKKKTTIKQLFSVASKFQKHLRRGIYLASIIYYEDKVLVTNEDFLPCIEIDESYPNTLNSDYHWLMKVACTWDDVKLLRTDMERNLTSAVHFRTKLLSAVCQMQNALGITDLGQLYYKPLRDSHGTVVLTCIQSVKSQKAVSILNSRWLPLNKLQKKIVALLEDYNINEMLVSSISDQIHYHQAAMQRLSPGLYLGYLKLQCSVEQIQVVVPVKTPNVLPHYKVRDNSHISAEEWQVLKGKMSSEQSERLNSLKLPVDFDKCSEHVTEVQRLFLYDLTLAVQKLFAAMNVKPEDAATHRLYEVEVVEHSKDISFLVICPSVELSCSVPGQTELLLQRDDLASLSIQAFEMIHLRTYQQGIIQKYARLSCILELDTALANHSQREAFSTSEMQTAKERLAKLQELTTSLNAVWKSVRWLMDVIAFARDKNAPPSQAMKEILEFAQTFTDQSSIVSKQQLLQLPTKYNKSGVGRGSWPGPTDHNKNESLKVEHSKSEQNLGLNAITPVATVAPPIPTITTQSLTVQTQTTTTTSSTSQLLNVAQEEANNSNSNNSSSNRKNSGDSNTSQYTTRSYYSAESSGGSVADMGSHFSMPPSHSDDAISLSAVEAFKQNQFAMGHRKRTISNITSNQPTATPLITIHSSNSTPYLSHEQSSGSSLSLNVYSSEYECKPIKPASQAKNELPTGRTKAASSSNIREGGLYLKTTLAALQTEIKNSSNEQQQQPAAQSAAVFSNRPAPKPVSSEEKVSSIPTVTQSTPATTISSTTTTTNAASSAFTSTSSSSMTSTSAASTSSGLGLPVSESAPLEEAPSSSVPASGIIQVYTAYNTGLARGTSLKLHVTPKTTAREVVNLVVKQLNMASVLKGNNGPIYSPDTLDTFCLVAVIGARERCLRDDFKPLLLQNPWKKGRLYVRQKHELLAAIEHSNRKSHLI